MMSIYPIVRIQLSFVQFSLLFYEFCILSKIEFKSIYYHFEIFRKIREIWNKIIELICINNAKDFVKNNIDDDAHEFVMVDVHKNTSFVEGNYRGKLVIVLHSVIDNYLETSLIQVKHINAGKYTNKSYQ